MKKHHPTGGTVVTGGFRTKKRPGHNGTDYRTRSSKHPSGIGHPIYAAGDGNVVRIYSNARAGNRVELALVCGCVVGYSHLDKINVEVGDTVEGGQVIARSGQTGNAQGPHLHFDVRPAGGDWVNPTAWLKKKTAATEPTRPPRATTYTVKAGDTLSKIAAAHGQPAAWRALYNANRSLIDRDARRRGAKGRPWNNIYPGQKLTLPNGW